MKKVTIRQIYIGSGIWIHPGLVMAITSGLESNEYSIRVRFFFVVVVVEPLIL